MGPVDRWRPSLCFSSPLTPDSLCQIIIHSVNPPQKKWQHMHTNNIYTISPVRMCVSCQFIDHMRNGHIRRGADFYPWHFGWAPSVVNWFSSQIDWTKLAQGSIAREGVVGEIQLVLSICYFLCSGSLKKRGNITVWNGKYYCMEWQTIYGCAHPQHGDTNGLKDNKCRERNINTSFKYLDTSFSATWHEILSTHSFFVFYWEIPANVQHFK